MKQTRQQHLKLFIELIGPSKQWPRQIRQNLFGQRHLNNRERFQCTVFLLCNGISPAQIKAYYNDCFNFDDAAERQINWILNQYPTSNWKQWNVAMGRSI